jgi:multiple sugar transport system permease protein
MSSGWGGKGRLLGAIAVSLLFTGLLLFMVAGSLREPGRPPPRTLELVPSPLTPANYADAADLVDLGRATLNSLLVAALTVPLTVLVASWAGFALARLPRRLANAVIAASLVALMVPLTALLVPRFALYSALGVTDTYLPLVAPALIATSPFYVLVYWFAFRRLPPDLWDACSLEGMTPFATWRRVAMPLVRPVTAAVAALAFLTSWSNFLDPLIYLYRKELFTVPLALKSLASLDPTNYPLLLAGAVLATIPVVVVFLVVQRWFLHSPKEASWFGS